MKVPTAYNSQDIFNPKNPWDNCTQDHPPLQFNINNKIVQIWGSSCLNPVVRDADLYISLDSHAPVFNFEQPWVFNERQQKHIRFFIQDFCAPKDLVQFNACLDFTIDNMMQDKIVHAGCISGHGRTGTLLTALTQRLIGEYLDLQNVSAIDYVRDNYCAKSVETMEQIFFLNVHFGVKIPKADIDKVEFIKTKFKETTGLELDQALKAKQFDACIEIINELEQGMYENNFQSRKIVSKIKKKT